MRSMSLNVSLSPHLEEFIRQQVSAGRFQSASEVVQTALRLLEEQAQIHETRLAWLQCEIDKGLASGPAPPVTAAFWDSLRRRLNERSDGAY